MPSLSPLPGAPSSASSIRPRRSSTCSGRAPTIASRSGASPKTTTVRGAPPSGAVAIAPDYLRRIQDEHRDIMEAISAGDASAAREAMRLHLKGSQDRYRRLTTEVA